MKSFFSAVFFLSILLIVVCAGCSTNATITGKVVRESGNRMPSPDWPAQEEKGFKTVVYFVAPFKARTYNGIPENVFNDLPTAVMAKVSTNSDGTFKINIAPGKYSVLIQKDAHSFYANVQDGEGIVNPWLFLKGKRYKLPLIANWDAKY